MGAGQRRVVTPKGVGDAYPIQRTPGSGGSSGVGNGWNEGDISGYQEQPLGNGGGFTGTGTGGGNSIGGNGDSLGGDTNPMRPLLKLRMQNTGVPLTRPVRRGFSG